MAKIVLHTFDRFINYLLLLLLLGGGMVIHTLTSLTIRSYYGDPWGYLSFLLPGVAEAYLMFVQLGDEMYNYSILLAMFAVTAVAITVALLLKNFLRFKAVSLLNKRATPSL
jgi:hypothetical protein